MRLELPFKFIFALLAVVWLTLPKISLAQEVDSDDDPVQQQIDSLLNLIKPDSPDSIKAKYYNEISGTTGNIDTTIKYALLSLQFCKESDDQLIATNNKYIAWGLWMNDETEKGIPYLLKSSEIFKKINNIKSLEHNYRLLSTFYEDLNKTDSIRYYIYKALEIDMALNDTAKLSKCYKTLGNIYGDKNFKKEAEQYFRKAIVLDSLRGDTLEYAFGYFRIGELYVKKTNDLTANYQAKNILLKSIILQESINSKQDYYSNVRYLTYSALASAYINIAIITSNNKYADSCFYYTKKALDHFLKQGHTANALAAGYTYVEYLLYYKRYDEALKFMQRQEKYVNDETKPGKKKDYYAYLRYIFFSLGDYKNAYLCFEQEMKYNDVFISDSTMSALAEIKNEQAMMIERIDRENAEKLHAAEKRRMRVIIISLWAGLGLVLFVIGLVFRVLVIKKRANAELSSKNSILTEQNEEIEAQRDTIKAQSDEIQASINYARRIQQSMLTPAETVSRIFPDHFILYKPRDVVSGDYYWVGQFDGNKVCIVADCTGHGVPGGFLSVLGMSNLNHIVGRNVSPDTILNRLRDSIISNLRQNDNILTIPQDNGDLDSSFYRSSDGMDVAAYVINEQQMTLTFAGANNPLVLIRDNKVEVLKGDRMPVGIHFRINPFHSISIGLQHGDCIYTFSDGYQDQFADGTHDKFTAQRLRDLLLEIHQLPMDEQHEILNRTFDEWRGPASNQTDDVVIMGVRI